MYDSITYVNNFLGVWNLKCRILLPYPVDCFSHYLCLAFNRTNPQSIFFEHIKAFGIVDKNPSNSFIASNTS